MKDTCSLCGGKLKEGICTECGMDNRKSDAMYYNRLNQSGDGHGALRSPSHVHTREGAEAYRQPSLNRNRESRYTVPKTDGKEKARSGREKAGPAGTMSAARGRKEEKKIGNQFKRNIYGRSGRNLGGIGRQKYAGVIAAVIIIAALFIGSIIGYQNGEESQSSTYSGFEEQTSGGVFSYDDEPGPSEEGEYWESGIPAGMYQVGTDIPEGEYEITGQQGSSLEVYDSTHSVYIHEYFGMGDNEIQKAEKIPLWKGAMVCVDGREPVTFVSENAQTQELEGRIANPLVEEIEVRKTMTAGQDFPAGTYDFQALEGFGYVGYQIPYVPSYGDGETDYWSFGIMLEAEGAEEYPDYCKVYKNVVLPEGAVVNGAEYPCRLIPSAGIVSEDYQSFYDNLE